MEDNTPEQSESQRWSNLARPLPAWFEDAKLGIFIHWGPYSVPAWAEPIGELGTIDGGRWYRHNPYAEWYFNTIRFEGSPAWHHQQETFGGAPYDDFIDLWRAEAFDARRIVGELRDAGADYLVLTTKHHDGVCLWDAPATGTRNTVHRGPRRDLVEEYVDACRELGMRFGAYYSGGLDWHVRPSEPIGSDGSLEISARPVDAEYAAYAAHHVRDLVERYSPDILWNDIEWPDAGKNFSEFGLGRVFEDYYHRVPEGVVNDRWHVPHCDYRTSEYQHMLDNEAEEAWENCRGVGLSFGYNRMEGTQHALSSVAATRHLVDVVSRGGRLLLGVGPKADGTLPEWQSAFLRELGRWMAVAGDLLRAAGPSSANASGPEGAWARRLSSCGRELLFVDSDYPVRVPRGELLTPIWSSVQGNVLSCSADRPGPAIIAL